MLDDLTYIHRIDKAGALEIAENEPDQLQQNFGFSADFGDIDNVVYAGMGGSALAASLSQTWPGYKVPFEIVRNYVLPNYVGEKTLCILSSYSGNTEETLSALAQAESKRAKITIITGGGQLMVAAKDKGYPLLVIPAAKQPRYAVFYNLKGLVDIGRAAGVIKEDNPGMLVSAADLLRSAQADWQPIKPTANNLAKQIALDCIGKSVVIYAGALLSPAAYKWKISFNENAKHIAWTGTYPEFNHNEFIGWSEQPVDKPYCVIDLRTDLENPRTQKRFTLSDRLLSGLRPSPLVVSAKGSNILEQLLYCVLLGDYVTIYTAIAGEIDPEPVDLVEKFKKLMTE
jgi:glucose/mannose-6-phosphate isomerase